MTAIQKPANGSKYQCFTLSTSIKEAKEVFKRSYGKEPEECFQYKMMVWAGPVEEE